MSELPQKELFKLSEVCQATDTQPYVLRFWESEFPQLRPERSAAGQPLYRRADIELVQRIKELLYDEDFTLDSAREQLSQERGSLDASAAKPRAARSSAIETLSENARAREAHANLPAVATNGEPPNDDMVSRRRYEHAVDEIDHLRMALKEAEKKLRRAEADLEQATADTERERLRLDRALTHLASLRRLLSGPTR